MSVKMTYCIGWRTSDAIFIAADAAVTSPVAQDQSPATSFGEKHVREPKRHVYEGALKIIRLGDAALTFAGDIEVGYKLAWLIAAQINSGHSAEEAFRQSVSSMITPSAVPQICAIFGCLDTGDPTLLTFNENRQGEVTPVSNIVQLGLRSFYKVQVSELIMNLESDLSDPRDRLACLVGFCQGLGVRSYLLEQGVGGPFSGCLVDKSGFHWLPDMSFNLYSGRPDEGGSFDQGEAIVSIVRDDIFFVVSPFSGGCTAFLNTGLQERSREEMIKYVDAKAEEVNRIVGKQKFDYSVIIGKDNAIIVIVRMDKDRITKHLGHGLNQKRISNHVTVFTSGFSSELGEVLKAKKRPPDVHPDIPYVQFIPYQPASLAGDH